MIVSAIKRRLVRILRNWTPGTYILDGIGEGRATSVVRRISTDLDHIQIVLDIGTGTGHVANLLRQVGMTVTAIDVDDLRSTDEHQIVIFDGIHLPFGDATFEAALILDVLHHTACPVELLAEARRVAAKLIVMESLRGGYAQRFLMFFLDRLINLEFGRGAVGQKVDREWREIFRAAALNVESAAYYRFWGLCEGVRYVLY